MGSSRSIKSKRLSSLRSSVRSDESKVSSIKSPIRIEEEVEFKPQPEILPKTELD